MAQLREMQKLSLSLTSSRNLSAQALKGAAGAVRSRPSPVKTGVLMRKVGFYIVLYGLIRINQKNEIKPYIYISTVWLDKSTIYP
jgi:hypothetical protein